MPIPRTHSTDAYGETASALIRPLGADLATLAREMGARFHDLVPDTSQAAEILRRLRSHELARLKLQQARYLEMLLDGNLTRAAHLEAARKCGRVHVLAGVESTWLVDAYAFYQEQIYRLLRERLDDIDSREALMRVFALRFQLDLEGQASSHDQVAGEVAMAATRIDQEMMSAGNLTDLVRSTLHIIGNLPGGVPSFFARVDGTGVLQIEQSHGEAAAQYHRAMEDGTAPKININPDQPSGQGPGGLAWRSGDIVVSDAWLIESETAPWLEAGKALGFRSSAAVPILGKSGRTVAMLSLYNGWPGYFSSKSIRAFLSHAQKVLSYGIQQRIEAPVVPLSEQNAYRTLLHEQRMVLHYQPVIDLRDGNLVKVEALARLRDRHGGLVLPGQFLPVLGNDELLTLFQRGMQQVCSDLVWLQSRGMEPRIAINIPAKGMDDRRYEQSFFQALEKSGLTPGHFQLEILETQDASQVSAHRKTFIDRLQAAGAGISQDDLGSGHSSLLRLDTYPFDEVKIDQGLVRGSLHNPKRALDFILHLTRLAHAFDTPVTVEGLENDGIMEAAAILGADHGQGYGIAPPMPVDRLPAWHRTYDYSIRPSRPRTAIGALAGYLLWDMQLATISEQPELIAKFAGIETMVEQFIKANHLQKSTIEQLLIRNRELVASRDLQSENAARTRQQLIKELADYWLRETRH